MLGFCFSLGFVMGGFLGFFGCLGFVLIILIIGLGFGLCFGLLGVGLLGVGFIVGVFVVGFFWCVMVVLLFLFFGG